MLIALIMLSIASAGDTQLVECERGQVYIKVSADVAKGGTVSIVDPPPIRQMAPSPKADEPQNLIEIKGTWEGCVHTSEAGNPIITAITSDGQSKTALLLDDLGQIELTLDTTTVKVELITE